MAILRIVYNVLQHTCKEPVTRFVLDHICLRPVDDVHGLADDFDAVGTAHLAELTFQVGTAHHGSLNVAAYTNRGRNSFVV